MTLVGPGGSQEKLRAWGLRRELEHGLCEGIKGSPEVIVSIEFKLLISIRETLPIQPTQLVLI